MSFTPNTSIHLCYVPFDATQTNQINFADTAAQTAYFVNTVRHANADCSYQRKDNRIRVGLNIDSLYNVNYVMYNNAHYTNKWFYAFITKMEYVGEDVTYIYIETDVFQTWFLECQLKESFVVREHQPVDAIGANFIEEKLETGEYMIEEVEDIKALKDLSCIVMSTTYQTGEFLGGRIFTEINGVPTAICFLKFANPSELCDFIMTMEDNNKASAIIAIFTMPSIFCPDYLSGYESYRVLAGSHQKYNYPTDYIPYNEPHYISINNSMNGYSPKNAKVYQYPFNLLHVTNMNGGSYDYRYEFFSNCNEISFDLDGGIMPNCVCKLTPNNYRLQSNDYMNSAVLTGYPMVAYSTDVFSAWLAQNAVSTPISIATDIASTALGVGLGMPGMAMHGVNGIGNEIGSIYAHATEPPQGRGEFEGSANIGMGIHTFHIMKMCVNAERAKIIDDYFTMYGYKQNKVKVPNITSRPKFNYIKTIDVNITGDIPSDDMTKLKKIFDDGLTVWHDPNHFCDYTVANGTLH